MHRPHTISPLQSPISLLSVPSSRTPSVLFFAHQVAGTPFDFFSDAKPIGRDMPSVPGGFDHNFVLRGTTAWEGEGGGKATDQVRRLQGIFLSQTLPLTPSLPPTQSPTLSLRITIPLFPPPSPSPGVH